MVGDGRNDVEVCCWMCQADILSLKKNGMSNGRKNNILTGQQHIRAAAPRPVILNIPYSSYSAY